MDDWRGSVKGLGILLFACFAGFLAPPSFGAYLTDLHIKQIRQNRADYDYASAEVGVPWKAIASLHYRESEFVRIPGCIGGAFGMDMGGDIKTFEARIEKEEHRVMKAYSYPKHANVQTDFRLACLCVADELKSKCRESLYDMDGDLKVLVLYDAMWGYNGRDKRHGSWRGSPYTANDPQKGIRFIMRWARMNGKVEEYLDERAGCVVIWRELNRIKPCLLEPESAPSIFPLLSPQSVQPMRP